MRVLERMRLFLWWFGGRLAEPRFTAAAAASVGCEWCGEDLNYDGQCDRCAELDARVVVFFDD